MLIEGILSGTAERSGRRERGVGQMRIKQLAYFSLELIMGVIYLSFGSLCDYVQLIKCELISLAFRF